MPRPTRSSRPSFPALQALFVLVLGGLTGLLGCSGRTPGGATVPEGVVGSWTGTTRVVNDWIAAETLVVALAIDAEGRVEGRVGDAVLEGGRIRRNRGSLSTMLGLRTDWIVEGDLSGDLIAAEGLRRQAVKIPLNLTEGRLVGGLHSSGSKLGVESRIVSAADLELVRDPEPPDPDPESGR